LTEFYRRIQPGGPGWKPVLAAAAQQGDPLKTAGGGSDFPAALLGASAATASVWSLIFTGGFALYGKPIPAVVCGIVAVATGLVIKWVWPRLKWS